MSSKKAIFLSDFSGLYGLIGANDWGLTREILKNLVKSVCYKPKNGLSLKLLSDKAFAEFKRRVKELTGRSWGVSMKYRLARLAEYVCGWMDYFGILEYYRPIPNKSLAASQGTHVLLETVAILPHQGSRAGETRHLSANRYFGRYEPERPLATLTHPGNPIRHDQSMAQESRSAVCQGTVGKHPLPGYDQVAHGNRTVRTSR
jgi:hypothetical protein